MSEWKQAISASFVAGLLGVVGTPGAAQQDPTRPPKPVAALTAPPVQAPGALSPAAGSARQTPAPSVTKQPGYQPISLAVISADEEQARARIEQVLRATIDLDFADAPLAEVVDFLRKRLSIPIIIDKRALDDVGLGSETPVNVSLHGISTRSALKLMLRQLELTYVVRDSVLKITTPKEAGYDSELRLYSVADLEQPSKASLFAGPTSPSDAAMDRFDSLVELIMSAVAPDTWDEVGGAGSIVAMAPWNTLCVRQTREGQKGIESLLAAIRKARKLGPADTELSGGLPVASAYELATVSKFEAALRQPANLDFNEAPLNDVVAFIRKAYKIPVIIDRRSLDDVGLGGDTPVTVSLKEVSLRSALKIMLKELDLTYVIHDEVLEITTPEEAELEPLIRVYPASDLLGRPGRHLASDALARRCDLLVNLIKTSVAPDTWDQLGGAGTVDSLIAPTPVLVVRQTAYVQEQIGQLLAAARRVRQEARPALPPAAPAAAPFPGAPTASPGGPPLVLKLYRTADAQTATMLMGAVRQLVTPGSWQTGKGTICTVGATLLVRQTPQAQRQVQELITAISHAKRPQTGFGGGMGGGLGGGWGVGAGGGTSDVSPPSGTKRPAGQQGEPSGSQTPASPKSGVEKKAG